MAKFYSARSRTIPPLPWQTFALPFSLVLMVLGVSPVLAPLAGSALLALAGWQAIFIALGLVGLGLIAFVATALPETRAPESRRDSHPSQAFSRYLSLLGSRQFMPFVLVSAVAQAGFFAYISGSAFVFITVHGLSPTAYSVLFALNAVGLIAANQMSAPAVLRFGAYAVARAATLVLMIAGLALVGTELLGLANVWSHGVLLFFVVAQAGMVMPVLSLRAMASFGAIAGTAAAMMGAIQFLGAAAASGAVGSLADGTALPLVCVIAGCGVLAAVIAFVAFPAETKPT